MNSRAKRKGNLYVALIVILMAVAIIAAVAGAMSRMGQNVSDGLSLETTGESIIENNEDKDVAEDVFSPSKNEDSKDSEAETEAEDQKMPSRFVNPTNGKLVKDYSMDVPVFSVTMEDYRTHNGIDIYVKSGERILAAAGGTISNVWEDPLMGTCISIAHSGGAETIYKNLSPELPEGIAVGAVVSEGTFIAVGGESALVEVSEEPHVHFEMKINGEYVDPCSYISFDSAEDEYEG